jgi:cytochrome c5
MARHGFARGAALGAALMALTALILPAPAAAQGAAPGALPPGDGRDMLATACSQCHTLGIILAMREGAPGWRRHVHNMVTRGAQLTASEAESVIGYLAANFGPATASLAAPAGAVRVALPAGAGRQLVEARCTVCHDLERVAVKRQMAEWAPLVANMVGRGATATPEEAQAIGAYLATHFGGE